MRVLVLYAHPVETSYNAALHQATVAALKAAGHEVDDCDLYAEKFDPVMSRQERIDYHDEAINTLPVQGYVDRLRATEALVLCTPVWNYNYPAILKGFIDRVFPARRVVQARQRQGRAEPLAHSQDRGGQHLRRLPLSLDGHGRRAAEGVQADACARWSTPSPDRSISPSTT